MKRFLWRGVFPDKISPLSFLYINPYDTPDILKKMQKSALFGIPFCKNFLIGTFFRSKPRCKKIVNRGGVVQVGKKRAPQGLFLRNLHPPLLLWRLNRTNFSSNEVDFFDVAKNFFLEKSVERRRAIFEAKKSPKKSEKNGSTGPLFYTKIHSSKCHFFMKFSGHLWGSFLGSFFGSFFRRFFRRFFREFFSDDFFLKIFSEHFSLSEEALLLSPTRDVSMTSYSSSASWAHRAHASEQLHVRERSGENVSLNCSLKILYFRWLSKLG